MSDRAGNVSTGSELGVCVFPEPPLNRGRTVNYPTYVHEVLAHAGVAYERVTLEELSSKLSSLKVLVTLGEHPLSDDAKSKLSAWVSAGGAWISVAGVCGMDAVLGASPLTPTFTGWATGVRSLGEGYLKPSSKHRVLECAEKPLHFFGGLHVRATDGNVLASALDKHCRDDGSPAVIEKISGKGRALLIAPDVTGTIVRVQQGIAVTRDGVAARDGSAPVDDSVLKSGDGGVLDYYFDRDPVPGIEGLSAYLRPVADQWREVFLRAIFNYAEQTGAKVPVLWMYPRNLPAIGHVSHDTDGNDPECCRLLLASLKRAGIRSTWCTIAPGYDRSLVGQIRGAGHELAMHYDSMTEGLPWGEGQFESQWRFLSDLLERKPVTNKNHYLRWEGDMEFFGWCEKRGIELDQSKGPSKSGEAGFNFGSCHPYFPVHFNGTPANVIELPTLTQDLTVFAPHPLGLPLLETAIRYHGVAHFLYHPAHFTKPPTAPSMEDIVAEGKKRGLEWWTAEEINTWERARRKVRWAASANGGIAIESPVELKDATLLTLAGANRGAGGNTVTRWGFEFHATVTTIKPATKVAVVQG